MVISKFELSIKSPQLFYIMYINYPSCGLIYATCFIIPTLPKNPGFCTLPNMRRIFVLTFLNLHYYDINWLKNAEGEIMKITASQRNCIVTGYGDVISLY